VPAAQSDSDLARILGVIEPPLDIPERGGPRVVPPIGLKVGSDASPGFALCLRWIAVLPDRSTAIAAPGPGFRKERSERWCFVFGYLLHLKIPPLTSSPQRTHA
jgi:hypothetical protein